MASRTGIADERDGRWRHWQTFARHASRDDAASLYARALAIRERALTPAHRKTKALREKLLAVRTRLP